MRFTSSILYITIISILCILSQNAAAAAPAKRALLIGIADYKNVTKLENPITDVRLMAEKLKSAGYITTVIPESETTRVKLLNSYQRFIKSVSIGDEVVVFYAGHGVDVRGKNMLVPLDAPKDDQIMGEFAVEQQLIPIRDMMNSLSYMQPSMQLWILDACRNNPYNTGARDYFQGGGLGYDRERPFGTVIFYSASYNQTAKDKLPSENKSGKGSPFSRTLVAQFDAYKDQSFRNYLGAVRSEVLKLVPGQMPTWEDAAPGDWCFVACKVRLTTMAEMEPAVMRKSAGGVTSHIPSNPREVNPNEMEKEVAKKQAVFLGKKSALPQCDANQRSINDQYPFGCDVLRKLVAHFDKLPQAGTDTREGFVGATLMATTNVNIRKGLPSEGKNGTNYGCRVKILSAGESVKANSTVALRYAGDTFYWATLEEDAECAPMRAG